MAGSCRSYWHRRRSRRRARSARTNSRRARSARRKKKNSRRARSARRAIGAWRARRRGACRRRAPRERRACHAAPGGWGSTGQSRCEGRGGPWPPAPRETAPSLAPFSKTLVGVTGFEPTTSWSRTKRSTKLSYTPGDRDVPYGATPVKSVQRSLSRGGAKEAPGCRDPAPREHQPGGRPGWRRRARRGAWR